MVLFESATVIADTADAAIPLYRSVASGRCGVMAHHGFFRRKASPHHRDCTMYINDSSRRRPHDSARVVEEEKPDLGGVCGWDCAFILRVSFNFTKMVR